MKFRCRWRIKIEIMSEKYLVMLERERERERDCGWFVVGEGGLGETNTNGFRWRGYQER